jgi:DNA-binding response OmpR family regulator
MVVVRKYMKLLVMEQSELVSKIYKKIFDEKQYEVDFAKNDSEFMNIFDNSYDYVVLDDSVPNLEENIRKIKPSQKILSLSQYIDSEGLPELKNTLDLIEKPFAILTMFGKLELESTNLGC